MPDSMVYLTTDAEMTTPHDYFYNWQFDTIDANYIVRANNDVNTYTHPDIYANRAGTLPAGLVLPVSKATADTGHNVIGEWYYSSDQWFKSNEVAISAGLATSRLNKL
jgi:hypothetical protein